MCGYKYWTGLLLAFCIDAVLSRCTYPGDVMDAEVVPETLKEVYNTDDLVLYECDGKGNGHVARYCQAGNTWTPPDRTCSESIIWNNGSLAGVLVAGFNFFMAIFAVAYSQKRFPGKGKKDASKPPLATPAPVNEDRATGDTKLSEELDEDNNKTKPELKNEVKADPQSSANISVRLPNEQWSHQKTNGEPSAVPV